MPVDIEKIKTLRLKLDYTMAEAAAKAGFKSRQAWNSIESGAQQNPGVELLERIAEALGVKAKDLLK